MKMYQLKTVGCSDLNTIFVLENEREDRTLAWLDKE